MANTKTIGDITESQILAALIKSGRDVLQPFGDNLRYDLVIDEDGKFIRIQCKTGRLQENGSITFKTCSTHCRTGARRSYFGEADLFGIYCPELDKTYLIPVDKCAARIGSLRVSSACHRSNTMVASDFEL